MLYFVCLYPHLLPNKLKDHLEYNCCARKPESLKWNNKLSNSRERPGMVIHAYNPRTWEPETIRL
jgi:hypothetical protein